MSKTYRCIALSSVGIVLMTAVAAPSSAEESCTSPLYRTSGINYDPVTVDPGSMSTAGLTMELLLDFQGSGLLAGNPTMV